MKHSTAFGWLVLLTGIGYGIDLGAAYPTGAGACPGGMPAVGGPHLSPDKPIVNGSLADGFLALDVDRKVTLAPSSDGDNPSIILTTGKDYLLRIASSEKRYTGFLIRLEAPDTVDTTTALIPTSTNAQIAEVCTAPVVGVCHFDNELKNFAGGTIRIDEPSLVYLDVTVVAENDDEESIFYYSRYTLKFVEEMPPTTSPTPLEQAPSAGPVATVPGNGCDASISAAEECLTTELIDTELAQCSQCIENSFHKKKTRTGSGFKGCDELTAFTCHTLSNCTSRCGSCVDEIESLLSCTVVGPLGCTLDCGFVPPAVSPTPETNSDSPSQVPSVVPLFSDSPVVPLFSDSPSQVPSVAFTLSPTIPVPTALAPNVPLPSPVAGSPVVSSPVAGSPTAGSPTVVSPTAPTAGSPIAGLQQLLRRNIR